MTSPQLMDAIIDLAGKATERGDNSTASILYVLAEAQQVNKVEALAGSVMIFRQNNLRNCSKINGKEVKNFFPPPCTDSLGNSVKKTFPNNVTILLRGTKPV